MRIKINTAEDVKVEAWGYGLTHDGYLVRFLGKASSDLAFQPTVQAVKLLPAEVEKVYQELSAVSSDRYAAWPTIEKYEAVLHAS